MTTTPTPPPPADGPPAHVPGEGQLGFRLTLGEWIQIERQLNRRTLSEITHTLPSVDFLQGILWMRLRRTDPTVTFEAAGEWTSEQINERIVNGEPSPDPDPPEGISLDGVRLLISQYSFKHLRELEDLLGRKIVTDMTSGFYGADLIRGMLWIKLRDQHPGLKLETLDNLLVVDLLPLLEEPELKENPAVDPQPAPDAASSSSGSQGRGSSKRSRRSAASTGSARGKSTN